MAVLNGSTITSSSSQGNTKMYGSVYADYQVNTSDTQAVISGSLYVKGWKYVQYAGTQFYGTVQTASSNVSASSGTVTKNFTEKQLVLEQPSEEGYLQIGTFSITIPRLTVAQNVTFAISSDLTVVMGTRTATGKSTGSILVSVPSLQSYPVTYYNNDGTSGSQTQTKYYNINLTLSPSTPSFSGYTFKGWATSAANAAAGTVAYQNGDTYSTNAALDLYAVWELTYSLPTITNLTVERCDSGSTLDDEGTYALVSFSWSVFQSASARYYGGNTYPYSSNSAACSITVGSVTVTPALSGSSGAETIKVGSGAFSVDTQYSASVTITDTQSIVSPHSQTVSGALPTSSFPMDINSDGSAVAFLRPAPDNGSGVYVGGDVDINSGKHYKINGTNLGASDVGAVPTGRTVNGKALSSDITLDMDDITADISVSGSTYSGGIEDEKLLTTATINKWKTILGIS